MEKQRTIIVTRAKTDDLSFENFLLENGYTVISFPTIEISYLKPNLDTTQLQNYSHIVFTSQNGVIGFFKLLGKTPISVQTQFVCIGAKTAKTLEQFGYKANIISKGNTAEDLANELKNLHIKNTDSILLSVGKKAGTVIEKSLNGFCKITRLEVYNTIQAQSISQEYIEIIENGLFDLAVFTSPSTFENFIAITGASTQLLHNKIACIGTTTAGKVLKMGFQPKLISSSANLDVFVKEIIAIV